MVVLDDDEMVGMFAGMHGPHQMIAASLMVGESARDVDGCVWSGEAFREAVGIT